MATGWPTASHRYRKDPLDSELAVCHVGLVSECEDGPPLRRCRARIPSRRRLSAHASLTWTRVGPGVKVALFAAQQLQLVLIFCKQSLESQVLADDGQDLAQQVPFPQTLETEQTVGTMRWHLETTTEVARKVH